MHIHKNGDLPRDKYKAMKRKLEKENKKYSNRIEAIPESEWPGNSDDKVLGAYRSCNYLIIVSDAGEQMDGLVQITVQRTSIDREGNFDDGIDYDTLQIIKNEVGYSNYDAIEVFPRHIDYYAQPNVRYLWVMTKNTLPFIWRRDPSITASDN